MINLNNVQSAKWRFRWVTIFLTSLLVIAISLSGQFVMQTAYAAPELIGNIATSISAGADYNCEIRSDSTLTCWGNSDDNQTLAPAGTFTQVSAGTVHTCAIKSDGTIACWGDNSEGQSTPPTGIFKRITAGTVHTCAIKSDDTLACWGNNDDHQVSDAPGGTFKQISAGDFHTCGIKSDDTIKCWGNDDDHQLDAPSGAFKQVSAGGSHTCAIQIDNIVKCWGTNDPLQLAPSSRSAPDRLTRAALRVITQLPAGVTTAKIRHRRPLASLPKSAPAMCIIVGFAATAQSAAGVTMTMVKPHN